MKFKSRFVVVLAVLLLATSCLGGIAFANSPDLAVEFNYREMLSPYMSTDEALRILKSSPYKDLVNLAIKLTGNKDRKFELLDINTPEADYGESDKAPTVEELVALAEELPDNVPVEENAPAVYYEIYSDFYIPEIPLDKHLQAYIYDTCTRKNIPVDFMFTLALHESGFNISVVSRTSDYGLFQINKCNHASYAKMTGTENDPCDPYINTIWSSTMINSYWKQWKEKFPSSLKDVIAHTLSCYNAGPTNRIRTVYVNGFWDDYKVIEKYFINNGYETLLTCRGAQ